MIYLYIKLTENKILKYKNYFKKNMELNTLQSIYPRCGGIKFRNFLRSKNKRIIYSGITQFRQRDSGKNAPDADKLNQHTIDFSQRIRHQKMDSTVFVKVVEIKKLRSKEENLWQMNIPVTSAAKRWRL